MGSVGYMPPEQVTAEGVDHRADIYAMGVVLYEMLALRNFITRGPIPVMLRASLKPTFQPPSKYRPDMPSGMDDVVKKAIEPNAEDRYNSAGEFLHELRRVVPERHTEGGMVSLISDLFGTAVQERAHEISQLLAIPMPEPPEDGPEMEHTVVFVEREGVQPLTEEDFSPTRVTVSGSGAMHSVLAATAAGAVPGRAMPQPQIVPSTSQAGMMMPGPNGHSMYGGARAPYPVPGAVPAGPGSISNTPLDSPLVTPFVSSSMVPSRGVPLGLVVAMIAIAMVLTAGIMYFVLRPSDDLDARGIPGNVARKNPPAPTVREPATPMATERETTAQAPVTPTPNQPPAPPPPTEVQPHRRRSHANNPTDPAAQSHTPAAEPAPEPPAPSGGAEVSNEAIDARLRSVIERARGLMPADSEDPKAKLSYSIQMGASQEIKSGNVEGKLKRVREFEQQLKNLESR
jgi:serine/threonine-protein kinase